MQKLLELMNRAEVYNGTTPIEQSKFFDKQKLRHEVLAAHMMNAFPIAMINGRLCIYINGIYTSDESAFERTMISVVPTLSISQRREVFSYIANICDKVMDESPANYIGLAHYVLDIDSGALLPYSPGFVIFNRIAYDYSPSAYHQELDDALTAYACGDTAIRFLIEEMIGYCLYRRNELGVAFFLKGVGSNGKSTILALCGKLLGEENYSSLELKDLNRQFTNCEIVGKLANLGDDISDEIISETSMFKKLVTGDPITIRGLYQKPFKLKSYSKQIFCCNEMPVVRDKSDGFGRRLLIVPLNARFSCNTASFDPYFIDRISTKDAMEYLLLLAVNGLKRVLANKGFTSCAAAVNATRVYTNDNKPLVNFVKAIDDLSVLDASDVYSAYKSWAIANGFQPMNSVLFGRELRKQTGYISKPSGKNAEGITVRRYVKENAAADISDTDDTDTNESV